MSGIDGFCAFDEAAGGGHEEGEGHVCGGAGENVRGVSDRDAASSCLGHFNVFEAHGDLADGAEVGGGVHELGVYLVGKEAEEAVYVGDLLQEGLVRRGEFVGPEVYVGLGGDHVDGLPEDAAGDEDFGFGHIGSWVEILGHYILRDWAKGMLGVGGNGKRRMGSRLCGNYGRGSGNDGWDRVL